MLQLRECPPLGRVWKWYCCGMASGKEILGGGKAWCDGPSRGSGIDQRVEPGIRWRSWSSGKHGCLGGDGLCFADYSEKTGGGRCGGLYEWGKAKLERPKELLA